MPISQKSVIVQLEQGSHKKDNKLLQRLEKMLGIWLTGNSERIGEPKAEKEKKKKVLSAKPVAKKKNSEDEKDKKEEEEKEGETKVAAADEAGVTAAASQAEKLNEE